MNTIIRKYKLYNFFGIGNKQDKIFFTMVKNIFDNIKFEDDIYYYDNNILFKLVYYAQFGKVCMLYDIKYRNLIKMLNKETVFYLLKIDETTSVDLWIPNDNNKNTDGSGGYTNFE